MANSLGALTVSLGLNAAEFTSGLTKAEFQAKRFADNLGSSLAVAGKIAGVGLGLVAAAAASAAKDIVASASALDDFADQTGSSVEALSKLQNQAQISGASFENLQSLVLKLTAGMAGADEESSNVGRALKALGVTAKDPAQALQEVALALSKYADGVGKAAVARDLFGKGGPAFLATLKDIAQFGDVAATTTTKQAEEAEKLEQSWRRLAVESTQLKNAVLSDLVPALNNLIGNFLAARQAGEGMFSALLRAGTNLDTLPDQIERAAAALANVQKAVAAGANNPLRVLPGLVADKADLDAATAKYKALIAIRDRAILAAQGDNSDQISRRFMQKPTLNYTGAAAARAGGGAGRIPKDQISDAERYLENLQKQLERTKDLSVEMQVVADIEAGRLKLSGAVTEEMLRGIAAQIDAAKALEKAEQDRAKLLADEARTREQISKMKTDGIKALQAETEALAEQNAQYALETEMIGKDAASLALLAQARLDDAINTKQQTLASYENVAGMEAEAAQIQNQIRLLQLRKGQLVERGATESLAAAAEEAKKYNDIFADSFADAATSVILHTQSIGKAIKSMEASIVSSITRIASQNIANALFGAPTSSGGGGVFGGIGGLFGSMFGGGGGGSGALGDAFISMFGLGGLSAGTNYARGGVTLVGERGPELVNLPRGAQVIPNHELNSRRASRGGTTNISVNVLPGASRTTADQAALRMRIAADRAAWRNG